MVLDDFPVATEQAFFLDNFIVFISIQYLTEGTRE